ncbi:hypothetical protein E2976_17520 [Paracoccus yeei]|uniref:hypothetical protein n=1 Tax=Paracoccus yeei TaxID=147645 RepID=UPI003BF884ED
MTDAERIAALKVELVETRDAGAALSAALLDTLTNIGSTLLASDLARVQVAQTLLDAAEQVHPAVAEVFREAAERLTE